MELALSSGIKTHTWRATNLESSPEMSIILGGKKQTFREGGKVMEKGTVTRLLRHPERRMFFFPTIMTNFLTQRLRMELLLNHLMLKIIKNN